MSTRNAELVNNATQRKATQHSGSQRNTTQRMTTQHNATQLNRYITTATQPTATQRSATKQTQHNRTHLNTTKQEVKTTHIIMLNKPVEVMSSSTKNSTEKMDKKRCRYKNYILGNWWNFS